VEEVIIWQIQAAAEEETLAPNLLLQESASNSPGKTSEGETEAKAGC